MLKVFILSLWKANRSYFDMRPNRDKLNQAESPFTRSETSHRKTHDTKIRFFFKSSAGLTIAILSLITIFLFKEGLGFFGQEYKDLQLYRQSGMEYADLLQEPLEAQANLHQTLIEIRADWINYLKRSKALSPQEIETRLRGKTQDSLFFGYLEATYPLREYVHHKYETAKGIRQNFFPSHHTDVTSPDGTDYLASIHQLTNDLGAYEDLLQLWAFNCASLLVSGNQIEWPNQAFAERYHAFKEAHHELVNDLPNRLGQITEYDPAKPISTLKVFTSFILGKTWISSSDHKDRYGLLPLLTGSLLIALIAISIAIPFSLSAAIYINQIAGTRERNLLKPYIEFISAIPSVVIGFFGVAVFGQLLKTVSSHPFLEWIPFFPIQERLNALTAGALLALMAIPTIFTLAEDALNNVPKRIQEASYSMGATRLQTIFKVVLPGALSGVISAIMLGFGRIIGETMVVLLCAGNRIKIPDFTQGVGVVFEPVHTMTGAIAQEMGEVVQGSLHYRALFMVGIVLFILSLLVNYVAQRVLKRYSHYTQ